MMHSVPFALLIKDCRGANKPLICGAPKRHSTGIIMENWSPKSWVYLCKFSSGA